VCWQCERTGHLWRGCPRGPAKETVDRSDWRRVCATDEKQRLDACEAAWERQIEELKAKVAELEVHWNERPRLKHPRRRAARWNASVV
jgi:hypothetical protein